MSILPTTLSELCSKLLLRFISVKLRSAQEVKPGVCEVQVVANKQKGRKKPEIYCRDTFISADSIYPKNTS